MTSPPVFLAATVPGAEKRGLTGGAVSKYAATQEDNHGSEDSF
jgi:hypothetical protein